MNRALTFIWLFLITLTTASSFQIADGGNDQTGQPEDMTGCVTAYVDALENKDANELARKLADEQAPNFPCGKQKPVFHGKVGSKISEPQYVYPDLSEAN